MQIDMFKYLRPQRLTEAEIDGIDGIDGIGSPLVSAVVRMANRRLTCAHCKRCARRCEVLADAGLDIGDVEAEYLRVTKLPAEDQSDAVLLLADEHPEFYHALRRCCFCGHCTTTCTTWMLASERMREWRRLLLLAGLQPQEPLVMVDNEWHLFNAYRAIFGVAYPEYIQLDDAAATGAGNDVDTLFFPGCSLVSYAPGLMRAIGGYLDATGLRWAMSDACCGSPLMSAGLFERSHALRQGLLEQVRAAGITRIVTVCPGCGEELAEVMREYVDIVPLPELLLAGLEGHGLSDGLLGIPADGTATAPASVTFFDSCHDRADQRHGSAVRRLLARTLPQAAQLEMEHHGKDTLCCGAGGAVAPYDPDLSQRRVWHIIEEARATGADTLVTACPTCSYTISQALFGGLPREGVSSRHYLELVFGQSIGWPEIFANLQSMWTGEWGPWLTQTFF